MTSVPIRLAPERSSPAGPGDEIANLTHIETGVVVRTVEDVQHLSAHELGATLPIANWPTTGSAHPGPPAPLYLPSFTVCLMDPKLDLPADASLPETTGHGVGSAPDRRSGRQLACRTTRIRPVSPQLWLRSACRR